MAFPIHKSFFLLEDVAITSAAVESDVHNMQQAGDLDHSKARLKVYVTEDFTSGTAPTLTAKVMDSADGTTFADALVGPDVALADLKKNKRIFNVPLPNDLRQYWKVVVTPSAAMTAGKVTAVYGEGQE